MTIEKRPARSPNDEQKIAIFHEGGKLLSAGAGSGKTFVLIEHLIFRLEKIKIAPQSEWKEKVPRALGQIVLMTFTKKAAGEMSVRLMNKIEALIALSAESNNDRDLLFWQTVLQSLSLLSITTIHGFCHRILKMGTWSSFPENFDLVSGIEHKNKLLKLFDRWFLKNKGSLGPLFLSNTPSLQKAMVEIFSSPELRLFWQDPHQLKSAENEIDAFFDQYLALKGLNGLFDEELDLTAAEKEKNKKWYELLVEFNELKSELGKISAENYLRYQDHFKTISRFPPSTSKEISYPQKQTMEQIKLLRNDLKEIGEDLSSLQDQFDIYAKWVSTITDLFQFMDKHYLEEEGLSFSDLEFYVLKALEVPEVLEKVKESWSYFIVDEFQDTSFIQFEILKKLTGEDHHKLFCVGDRKQAIYGFRGGELQVFQECAQKLGNENNYFLRNNFRSLSAIVQYNNLLFENVFPLGPKYEGSDPHSVEMEKQNVPPLKEVSATGKVICLKTEVIGAQGEIDLDALEAKKLLEHINTLLNDEHIESICVLYRKLRPSAYLLDLLLEQDVPFSAQVKIKFSEDPVFNLFLYLVQVYMNRDDEKKKNNTIKLLETLLSVLGVKGPMDENVKSWLFDIELLGPEVSFHKFIYSLGLSNSFHALNTNLIDAICRMSKGDPAKIFNVLNDDGGEDYACDMMRGASGGGKKKRIIIMSAHASKGLEFDAILLGGIHSNGRYNGMKEHIGKFPHSFKWKKSLDQKKFFKSPMYHLESEISSLKDFSESKRLLYVACTRAVKQLVYVDLWRWHKEERRPLYLYDNSWIQGLRRVECEQYELQVIAEEKGLIDISLLQKDPLGLLENKMRGPVGVTAELSVTRLASLAECPFKFYLQNICKIEPETRATFTFLEEAEEDDFHSSKKRGTELHEYLSRLILKKMDLEDVPRSEQPKVHWALEMAQKVALDHQVISEKLIKFSFFGQMISGTPDLVFLRPQEKLQIWDYKTGMRRPENEESYWLQLYCYAYAYIHSSKLPAHESVEISLLYLDQKEKVTRSVSLEQITQFLFRYWSKTEHLYQINPLHCKECPYSGICTKGQVPI